MLNLYEQAKAYYQSAPADPWRWDDEARVLVWIDGNTIAIREEMTEILENLATNGLPPFRLVVLILAACRGKLPPSSANGPAIRELDQALQLNLPAPFPRNEEPHTVKVWNDPSNQEFTELIARLRLLHELPAEQKLSPRSKAVLIDCIFDQLRVGRIQPAVAIASALREMPALRDLNGTDERSSKIAGDYRMLHAGLRHFSVESLALRQRTGLDVLPVAADVELRPSERARQLLATLRSDAEHQGLAKIARDLMAALYLPRSLSDLDELALGGFCDISNRGSLDRLLPSELANDDLTLGTRVALNEALYIRREPPTSHPPAQLAVLLDIGVRQWGLPRVFATAVALALMAKEDRCTNIAVWRARRNSIERSDLLSRTGLINHLSALDSYAHPGNALGLFFAQFAQQPEMEAVLVTHPDTIADPDFQRCLARIDWKKFYVAMVDRDGSFELYAHPHRKQPLCRAEIRLDSLFPENAKTSPSAVAPPLLDPTQRGTLPLIFSVSPFPFLLPILGKLERASRTPSGGGLGVLKDRRLIRWDSAHKGAYTLVETLPPGKISWIGATDHGKKVHVLSVLTKTGAASLTTWDETVGQSRTADLASWNGVPETVYERQGILFILSRTEAAAWQIEGASPLGKIHFPPGTRLLHGRYLCHANGECSFLSFRGNGVGLEPVAIAGSVGNSRILALFDRAGFESRPWVLTALGEIFSGDGKWMINLQESINRFEVSEDGHRLLLYPTGKLDCFMVDLVKGTSVRTTVNRGIQACRSPLPFPTRSMRIKFNQIGVTLAGELMLKAAKGAWLKVALVDNALRLTEVKSGDGEVGFGVAFESVPAPSDLNIRLHMAAWPDGSKAWLDSRGLLHLKRGNSSNPEVTLVLADGPMAAWSSDGKICGPEFFLREPATADAATLMRQLELFCPVT